MKHIEAEHTDTGRHWDIKFSRIKTAWLRRSVMILALPFMLAANLLLIAYGATKWLLSALLWLTLKTICRVAACPFDLWIGLAREWNGKRPAKD
ncbi:MAG: hypothetical protein JWQ01_4859 [Massilia sp.]|nr:hypothetical protein [Massilia sp.]